MTDVFELLVDGVDFGEGPRWHDGAFWYSDFYQHSIYRVSAAGERTAVYEGLPDRPSGLGWLPDGRMVVVFMVQRAVMVETVPGGPDLELYGDLSNMAAGLCNDMIVSADGHCYVGEFGFDLESGQDFALASLMHIAPDRTTTVAAGDMRFPNGTVVTPDDKTLIVGESFGGTFVAFDRNPDGTLTNRRIWASVPGTAPDGCTLDSEGAIWFADAIGGDVVRVLEGGEITERRTPPIPAFACMLGGDDAKTLFVVSAPSADPAEVAGIGAGAIYTTRVDVAG